MPLQELEQPQCYFALDLTRAKTFTYARPTNFSNIREGEQDLISNGPRHKLAVEICPLEQQIAHSLLRIEKPAFLVPPTPSVLPYEYFQVDPHMGQESLSEEHKN